MLRLSNILNIQLKKALERAFPNAANAARVSGSTLDPVLVPASKPEFGDFQVNGALNLAKALKQSPRDIALAIVAQLHEDEEFLNLCKSPEIAGPGFINLTLTTQCLIREINNQMNDHRLGVPLIDLSKTSGGSAPIVIDFSSPNIAKEMHVGHLRSTIIGDSLARVLEFRGHSVLRLNHVGDWGTQFGMLISHLKLVAPEALTTADAIDLGDLVNFYRQAKQRFDEDELFQDESREEVIKLQNGDLQALKAWKLLCDQSRQEFQKIYDRLDIRLNERGESFYNPYLKNVLNDLDDLGLLVTDEGAKCVFLESITGKDGKSLPMIIQKQDGGFNYATTDLAAIRYRLNSYPDGDGAQRLIYVTDAGQSNHFAGVFEIAERAKWIPNGCHIEHVPFGLVQGEDGKKLKTRSGETVRLRDLLDEAIDRAESDLRIRLKKEGRDESQAFIKHVSTTVGIAAVKYADLSQNRITNYQFSFNKMLALQGNTAPYLLYALVRIAGIARKGGNLGINIDTLEFNQPQEWCLIRELLKFDEVIIKVEEELLPNRLCSYLFDLSQVFNRFYDKVPVLKANEPNRSCRLALCRTTANTLKLGMTLLGIPTLERM
ncbi:arginine--tRNA ligase [Prochlorococcus sp. MIT 1307]|uniref:arginine--tRNA ligase n=1 Tax=Prochlorococcus sp. MIT 1307 TaxID=3096219 RepID=UPI002A76128D|nr:arginine--tRNA ligase [Prochlorococcus sp. MIT 1307]